MVSKIYLNLRVTSIGSQSAATFAFRFRSISSPLRPWKKFLEAEHLVFCGFMLPKSIKAAYQHCFPEDSNGTSLSNWGEFESNNPSTFQSMYQFWAYKPL